MEKTNKLPLFKVQRDLTISTKKTWLIKIIGIISGVILCALMSTILKPGTFFDFFGKLTTGSFGGINKIMEFLEEVSLLLIISLALTPAFRMKFWNIGAEGQVLAGALTCYAILKHVAQPNPDFPIPLLIIIMVTASILAGILWAVIPAIFKAFFNTNETLFTLMMNYVAMGLIVYFISIWAPSGSGVLDPIYSAQLPTLIINQTNQFNTNYLLHTIIAALLVAIIFIYIRFTKHGYEIDVVGGSQNTARYVGINVKKIVIRTMALSGAICGLIGFLLVASGGTVSKNLAGGRGFTAVLICWLSSLNPIEMILSSSLVAFISKGSNYACDIYYTNGSNYSDIMVGVFFFVIIAFTFFSKYKVSFPRFAEARINKHQNNSGVGADNEKGGK